ncbi:MAG: 8-oxo-dGTP diphosphatase [Eubacteriales bacterium]|nr:8-oxo-dGTP diphosphatase [Eubacteriales bacterium]
MSTLVYIEQDGKYLMLHRVKKAVDINHGKWIGVGGHFEEAESPEECLLREVREETGYRLTSWNFRGIVTFVSGKQVTEYMHLFTADGFTGEPLTCDEGNLAWVDKHRVLTDLELWPGDRIFLRILETRDTFFSLKLVYDEEDVLCRVILDGREWTEEEIGNAVRKPDGQA